MQLLFKRFYTAGSDCQSGLKSTKVEQGGQEWGGKIYERIMVTWYKISYFLLLTDIYAQHIYLCFK